MMFHISMFSICSALSLLGLTAPQSNPPEGNGLRRNLWIRIIPCLSYFFSSQNLEKVHAEDLFDANGIFHFRDAWRMNSYRQRELQELPDIKTIQNLNKSQREKLETYYLQYGEYSGEYPLTETMANYRYSLSTRIQLMLNTTPVAKDINMTSAQLYQTFLQPESNLLPQTDGIVDHWKYIGPNQGLLNPRYGPVVIPTMSSRLSSDEQPLYPKISEDLNTFVKQVSNNPDYANNTQKTVNAYKTFVETLVNTNKIDQVSSPLLEVMEIAQLMKIDYTYNQLLKARNSHQSPKLIRSISHQLLIDQEFLKSCEIQQLMRI